MKHPVLDNSFLRQNWSVGKAKVLPEKDERCLPGSLVLQTWTHRVSEGGG